MQAQTIQALLNAAVRSATYQTRRGFQLNIDKLTNKLSRIRRLPF